MKILEYGGAVIAAALIMGLFLISSEVTVNLKHQHSLPNMTQHWIKCKGVFFKSCDVRLSTIIDKPEKYKDLLHLLDTLDSNDTIKIHLIGQGGRVDSAIQLINAIRHSDAEVITVVEAPVYSAHAFIAMAGHKVKILDSVTFMVHHSSALNETEEICEQARGKKDRGQDLHHKCEQFYQYHLDSASEMIMLVGYGILTAQELYRIHTGFDVYITGEDMKGRLKAKGRLIE